MESWVEFNDKYASIWPNITLMRPEDVPPDAEDWQGVEGKMEHFSEAPGKGD
jgi:ferredoxin